MNMTNEKMLELIRLERPSQVINKVNSFSLNEFGYYDVMVDMKSPFLNINHHNTKIVYPLDVYFKINNIKL